MLLLASLPLLVFADMNITTKESVSQEIMPDILQGTFNFSEDNKNADIIKEHLNALVTEVKQFDEKKDICQGGGYQIMPQYTYSKENKRNFIGYSGSLLFQCSFKSIEEHNALLSRLDKAKAESVIAAQGRLMWIPSEKQYKKTYLSLRSSLLVVAKEQAEAFSKDLKLGCEVNTIRFLDERSSMHPVRMAETQYASSSYKSAPTQEPIQQDIDVLLKADVEYVCKKGK